VNVVCPLMALLCFRGYDTRRLLLFNTCRGHSPEEAARNTLFTENPARGEVWVSLSRLREPNVIGMRRCSSGGKSR
jgi:hypothetical protein